MTASILADSPIFSSLPESLPLRRYGFQVVRHGGPLSDFEDLKARFAARLRERLASFGARDAGPFVCEAYHDVLGAAGVDHHAFIKAGGRNLPADWLRHPFLTRLVERASAHVGRALRVYGDVLEFRVVRPGRDDNNPWHRDHWFSYFSPLLNVYLPLSGSHVDSALQVVPRSHLWTDEECKATFAAGEGKTNKGGVLYSVPEIQNCVYELRGHRLDLVPGDFAVFSPRMVHGEGTNASPETRFSLEFRLEAIP